MFPSALFAPVVVAQVAAPEEAPKNEGNGQAPVMGYCTIA
uniref:Mating factor a2.1 n=1 Tax=Ustanciosporium gigantosporum TaxID=1134041 RepID=H2CZ46_9BASI|nr:mating factor a2.1 [Ustanciosporium gigantosporum]AEY62534.1 mating factor a3.1 [Ustanciosporium gigantosporum]